MGINYQIDSIDDHCKKIIAFDSTKQVGRVFLYILKNDLHKMPFGFIEDLNVDENYHGKGIGKTLVKMSIDLAKNEKCYKIVCTSRFSRTKVHEFYKNLGFIERGIEFRIDL